MTKTWKLLIIVFLAIEFNCIPTESKVSQVPITQCCADGEFYHPRSDSCYLPDNETDIIPSPSPLLLNNFGLNETIEAHQLIANIELSTCIKGYTSNITKEFQISPDGSVQMNNQINLQFDNFCLNKMIEETSLEQEYVIRYCVPDPCYRDTCIRKCCLSGMLYNSTSRRCQMTNDSFELVFADQSGTVVHQDNGSYIIRDGYEPRCWLNMHPLMPDVDPFDSFYILPNGTLYTVATLEELRIHEDYCIEDFITEEDDIIVRYNFIGKIIIFFIDDIDVFNSKFDSTHLEYYF